jgi:hypothetical protein
MNTQTKSLPKVLSFTEFKSYIFSAAFITAAVAIPAIAHQFNLAGPEWLPIQYFVLIAGYLLGWQVGLVTGLFSVIFSFALTNMPPAMILPQVILEIAVYGLAIGILREKKMNIFVSLVSAMVLGRLARIAYIMLFTKMSLTAFIAESWQGIILQIILIPAVVLLSQKYVFEKRV